MSPGSLPEPSLAAVLGQIARERLSGTLLLERAEKSRSFHFRAGDVVGAESSVPGEGLVQLLLAKGHIPQDKARIAMVRSSSGRSTPAQALVRTRAVIPERLGDAVLWHARMLLVGTFAWAVGTWQWVGGEPDADVAEGEPVVPLIITGIGTRLSPLLIEHGLRLRAGGRPELVARLPIPLAALKLDVPERRFASSLDGNRDLEQVIAYAGIPADDARRVLYLLSELELVTYHQEEVEVVAPVSASVAPQRTAAPAEEATLAAQLFGASAAPRPSAAPPVEAGDEAELGELTAEQRARYHELGRQAQEMEQRTYFEWFELDEVASEDQVKARYRQLAKTFHPDVLSRQPEAIRRRSEAIFARLTEAYDTLTDASRREAYQRHVLQGEPTEDDRAMAEVQAILEAEEHFKRGLRLMNAGRMPDARKAFADAHRVYDKEAEYIAHLGWATFSSGFPRNEQMMQRGEEQLREAMAKNEQAPSAYLFMGKMFHRKEEYAKAREYLMRALKMKSNNAQALAELDRLKQSIRRARNKPKGGVLSGLFGRFKK